MLILLPFKLCLQPYVLLLPRQQQSHMTNLIWKLHLKLDAELPLKDLKLDDFIEIWNQSILKEFDFNLSQRLIMTISKLKGLDLLKMHEDS